MTIDSLLHLLQRNGTRIFAGASYFESFVIILTKTRGYLGDCRKGMRRDERMERDLGGAWLAVAKEGTVDRNFADACHTIGVCLCRAPINGEFSALETYVAQGIKSVMSDW